MNLKQFIVFIGAISCAIITPPLLFMYQTEKQNCEQEYVFLSSRITDCEISGGKYSLRWSSYGQEYEEECNTEMKEIKNF